MEKTNLRHQVILYWWEQNLQNPKRNFYRRKQNWLWCKWIWEIQWLMTVLKLTLMVFKRFKLASKKMNIYCCRTKSKICLKYHKFSFRFVNKSNFSLKWLESIKKFRKQSSLKFKIGSKIFKNVKCFDKNWKYLFHKIRKKKILKNVWIFFL